MWAGTAVRTEKHMVAIFKDMVMQAMIAATVAMVAAGSLWLLGNKLGAMRCDNGPRTSDPRTWDLPFAIAFAGFFGLFGACAQTLIGAGRIADIAAGVIAAIMLLVLPHVAPTRRP
jgi:hypothetical protein